MTEYERYGSGNWFVSEGQEEEFIQRWREFLQWTRDTVPGLHRAHLLRDEMDPRHFVSFGDWTDAASRDAWMEHPDFQEHIGPCVKLCDDVHTSRYEQVATV